MSVQDLHLIIYHSPLFAAHWALFLPHPTNPDSKVGTRIHADGSPGSGFEVLFENEYDLRECTQTYEVVRLGAVRGEEGKGGAERVVGSIEAPGKSLVGVGAFEGRRRRVQLKNCQTWVKDAVGKLVEDGFLGLEALETVERAPKN